jgi:hypothetical protein
LLREGNGLLFKLDCVRFDLFWHDVLRFLF